MEERMDWLVDTVSEENDGFLKPLNSRRRGS